MSFDTSIPDILRSERNSIAPADIVATPMASKAKPHVNAVVSSNGNGQSLCSEDKITKAVHPQSIIHHPIERPSGNVFPSL